MIARALAIALIATLANPARADAPRPAVDWAAGRLTATGFGVADRQAPSPAAARGPARRAAETAARARLTDAIAALPVARGGTVAAAAKSDAAIATRLAAVVARAREVSADLETDGSWQVSLAVPLEAVHQALTGVPAAGDEAHSAPPVVVIESSAPPALGYRIAGRAAAIVWVDKLPTWARAAPRTRAKLQPPDELALAKPLGGPATLYVVVR